MKRWRRRALLICGFLVLFFLGFSVVWWPGGGQAAMPNSRVLVSGQMSGPQTVTVEWSSDPAATGYRLYRDGIAIGTRWRGATSTKIYIGKSGDHTLEVVSLYPATTTAPPPTTTAPPPTTTAPPPTTTAPVRGSYDAAIQAARPVGYWTLDHHLGTSEPDESGNGNTGTYMGGIPTNVTMPNGDTAGDFTPILGAYLSVPSSESYAISKTRYLTVEAWIRPTRVLWTKADDPYDYGYVDFAGKCANYSPSCEWEARMYSQQNPQGRVSRTSGYVFNNSAGLGSAADWQPAGSSVIVSGKWYHFVAEYQTALTPTSCQTTAPGTIEVWINGVQWNSAYHRPTGCMSQYNITPTAASSPVRVGTMANETWFPGAIGKFAIYDRLLSPAEISEHYVSMTGQQPKGSCQNECTLG